MSPLNEPLTVEIVEPKPPHAVREIANNIWALYALLFLVTGVLGLPLIFLNTKLSRLHKGLLATAVTLYTASLFFGLYAVLIWCWGRISSAL